MTDRHNRSRFGWLNILVFVLISYLDFENFYELTRGWVDTEALLGRGRREFLNISLFCQKSFVQDNILLAPPICATAIHP